MRRTAWALILVALCANLAVPAFGGDTSLTRVLKLDKREARHYNALDKRIKAAGLLALQPPSTDTDQQSMTTTDGTFYSGRVTCTTGRMTGGGVDWAAGTVYGQYHVVYSSPWPNGWQAMVSTGSSPRPAVAPRVYVICAK